MKLLASLALLAFVTWALHAWVGLFENRSLAIGIWIGGSLLIAFLFDRKDARREGKSLLGLWRSPPR